MTSLLNTVLISLLIISTDAVNIINEPDKMEMLKNFTFVLLGGVVILDVLVIVTVIVIMKIFPEVFKGKRSNV